MDACSETSIAKVANIAQFLHGWQHSRELGAQPGAGTLHQRWPYYKVGSRSPGQVCKSATVGISASVLSNFLDLIMAPSAVEVESPQNGTAQVKQLHARQPLKSTRSLDRFESVDITPVIGTEFPEANLVELLKSPNADEYLRDLAIKSKPIRAYLRMKESSLTCQSLSGVWYSSGSRTTSPTISRRNSFNDSAN